MCSTFKVLASSAILHNVDAGKESLERRVYFNETDLVTYSPETKKHVGPSGMTIAELCKAAITLSDNTAGNLLLASIGGPKGFTDFARSLGDKMTRLDRIETALNEALPDDPRDTTTPNAMASDLQSLVLGKTLSAKSRAQLVEWLAANTTGGKRLRAGLPTGWHVGDKTGTGDRGTANDIAVIWPTGAGAGHRHRLSYRRYGFGGSAERCHCGRRACGRGGAHVRQLIDSGRDQRNRAERNPLSDELSDRRFQ